LETVKRLYEGLFLVDSAIAAGNWQLVEDTIHKILNKAGAEVVSFRKWDERKLISDIGKVSRGTYILVYFNCDTLRVHDIERDVQLSETLMRVLILRTDRMSQSEIDKPTPIMMAETQAQVDADATAKRTEDAEAEDADEDIDSENAPKVF
jgi:ribosomal protein S6